MSLQHSMPDTGGPTRLPLVVGAALATLLLIRACLGGSHGRSSGQDPMESEFELHPTIETLAAAQAYATRGLTGIQGYML